MRADVEAWLADPAANHGWLLRGDESAGSTAKRFESRETPDPSVRPVLVVAFGRPAATCADAGLPGAALGTCVAYCDASACAANPTATACVRLAERFARESGGATLPCVAPADADGDGVPDAGDDCPAIADPDQLDGDADGVGDACDDCVAVANADQADGFGEIGVGDACDCPCFTSFEADALAAALADASVYAGLVCIDTRANAKPLTALSAVRIDGQPCAVASQDCGLLAVEFTEDQACQANPPAPAPGTSVSGIAPAQREACRERILAAAAAQALVCN